jgi:hypothetical protein
MEVVGQLHIPATVLKGKTHDAHWIGGLLGPSVGMDVIPPPLLRIGAYSSGMCYDCEMTDREMSILLSKESSFVDTCTYLLS